MTQNFPSRYLALDAVRGLTLALMILVNTPGSWNHIYAPLQHADWHGYTPADLVFPFFLFVVGSAMFFSLGKSGFSLTIPVGRKILQRTVIIFGIGVLFNAFPFGNDISEWRIMGVLQRIALAYCAAAFIVLLIGRSGIIAISALLLIGYWFLLMLSGGADPYGLESNVVRWFDVRTLGENHLWAGKGLAFDPEGLLSTLPAIVNVLFGFEVARFLSTRNNPAESAGVLMGAGALIVVFGLVWSAVFPINKSLWTSSFVVVTAGYFAFVVGFFIWLVDVKKCDRVCKPLMIYGSNPLFVFILSGLWPAISSRITLGEQSISLYDYLYVSLAQIFQPLNASLVFALLHVLFFFFVSWLLYRNRIFIKV